MTSYSSLPNKLVSAVSGIDFAYRDAGQGGEVPLILLQHFRGNLDNWAPALVDELAATRRVVTFDNAGVGGSSGATPHEIRQMAHDAIEFIAAMGFTKVDILGFSIGSFVAQELTLIRPDLVRRLVLASAAPKTCVECWIRTAAESPVAPGISYGFLARSAIRYRSSN